ncbi:Ger(x)C family spore germination protein [Cohnella sp. GCM10027633]|uniref:Ger(x)C family spore germination protein n=1 Tax=unclassified Cohnella TaxID=2636738 RepID=UPI003635FF10
MRRKLAAAIAVLCACTLLGGCWDIKNVADFNFVTALGIDYDDGKYTVYTELMDYSVVGNESQDGGSQERSKVWVGQGTGNTVYEAITELYRTVQQNLYWDHIMAIVLSDRVLKQDIRVSLDALGRFPQIRYTSWVYGTREPIDKLFMSASFINVSPIATLLHNPKALYQQRSDIYPVRFLEVSANDGEPGQTDMIPSLGITAKAWKDNDKKQPVLYIDGAYALKDGKADDYFENEQLKGLRWTQSGGKKLYLRIEKEGKTLGMVALFRPRKKVRVSSVGGKPAYAMDLGFTAIVEEAAADVTLKEVETLAKSRIREEVLATFEAGVREGADIYGLEQAAYRQRNRLWKSARSAPALAGAAPDERSLTSVNVAIRFLHTGAYDMRPE